MTYIRPVILTLLLLLFLVSQAFAQSPRDTVKEGVDAIITIVLEAKKTNSLDASATDEKLWDSVDAVFDFEVLSRKTLGKNWPAMKDEEKSEFVSLFRKLLGRAYLNKIKEYDNDKILYLREAFPAPDNAEVFTQVKSKDQQFDLNYRLSRKEEVWKIYDVSIEGASLLSNYRSQFNDFLKKNTVSGLLDSMRTKVSSQPKTTN